VDQIHATRVRQTWFSGRLVHGQPPSIGRQ
jgi:hypothetical protein